MTDIKIEKVIEIEDDKTYVLEVPFQASFEQMAIIQKTWKEVTDAKLIILTNGAKLACVGEAEIREQIAKDIEKIWKCDCGLSNNDHYYHCPTPTIEKAAAIARGQE